MELIQKWEHPRRNVDNNSIFFNFLLHLFDMLIQIWIDAKFFQATVTLKLFYLSTHGFNMFIQIFLRTLSFWTIITLQLVGFYMYGPAILIKISHSAKLFETSAAFELFDIIVHKLNMQIQVELFLENSVVHWSQISLRRSPCTDLRCLLTILFRQNPFRKAPHLKSFTFPCTTLWWTFRSPHLPNSLKHKPHFCFLLFDSTNSACLSKCFIST